MARARVIVRARRRARAAPYIDGASIARDRRVVDRRCVATDAMSIAHRDVGAMDARVASASASARGRRRRRARGDDASTRDDATPNDDDVAPRLEGDHDRETTELERGRVGESGEGPESGRGGACATTTTTTGLGE